MRLAPALIASILLGASFASQAHMEAAQKSFDPAACKAARLSAWFERQRQLTEGDTNPFVQPATPAECIAVDAGKMADAAGKADGKDTQDAKEGRPMPM